MFISEVRKFCIPLYVLYIYVENELFEDVCRPSLALLLSCLPKKEIAVYQKLT